MGGMLFIGGMDIEPMEAIGTEPIERAGIENNDIGVILFIGIDIEPICIEAIGTEPIE